MSSSGKITFNFLSNGLLPSYISHPTQKGIFILPNTKHKRKKQSKLNKPLGTGVTALLCRGYRINGM